MEYHISDRIAGLKPSAIREIFKYAADPSVISLAAGDPAPESLPVEKLQAIASEILNENPMQALLYSQSEGYPLLRETIRDLVETRYGLHTENDEIMVTSGAQQVMDLTTKVLCNSGDTVICEDPSFIGSLNAFRSYGVNLVGVPMEDDGIHIGKLEEALKANPNTRIIYVIPNFNNPTGKTMSWEKRKAVYALAQKYQVVVLEDNPYGDLRFTGESIPSIKTLDTDGLVVYAGTFSKILSSGMRVGYFVAPKGLMGKLTVAKQCVDVHTSMLTQLICYKFLKTVDLNEHIEGLKVIYERKCTLMLSEIEKQFPKEVTHTNPEGGLFVWCTMPDSIDSGEFATRLVRDHKVCVVPGSAFMIDDTQKTHTFRMNFSMPSEENIVKGVATVGALLHEMLGK